MLRRQTPAVARRRAVRKRCSAAASLGLVLLAILGVFGCSGKEDQPAAKAVIRLVTWKPNQPEVWDEVYNAFAAANPDIELILEIGPHSSTAFHDLLTQKLKNKSKDVDVFLMDVIWPPEFGAAGWAAPLDELFPVSERDKFLEGGVIANTYAEHIYGVPLYLASGVLYYRKDLLAKYGFQPPETWHELISQAQEITSKEAATGAELYGFSGQFKQYEGLVCNMMEYILSNRARVLDPKTGKSTIAEAAAVEAVRFVREQLIGSVAPQGVLTYQEPESLSLFIQGQAVFHRNWPYAWEISNNPERSLIVGKVGISTLPCFPGGESHSTLGGWQVGISRYSENKPAAWRLVEFLTNEETQKRLALGAGLAPTRKALYQDAEVLEAHPQFSALADVFRTAHPRPRSPLYPAISNVLQRYFSKAISDPAADVAAEARNAAREINKLASMLDAQR